MKSHHKGTKAQRPMVALLCRDRDGLIRCRVCGCTEREPCCPPCSWTPGEADLCSTCAAVSIVVQVWFDSVHHASWAALKREVEALYGNERVEVRLTELGRKALADRRPYHGSAAEGNY